MPCLRLRVMKSMSIQRCAWGCAADGLFPIRPHRLGISALLLPICEASLPDPTPVAFVIGLLNCVSDETIERSISSGSGYVQYVLPYSRHAMIGSPVFPKSVVGRKDTEGAGRVRIAVEQQPHLLRT